MYQGVSVQGASVSGNSERSMGPENWLHSVQLVPTGVLNMG